MVRRGGHTITDRPLYLVVLRTGTVAKYGQLAQGPDVARESPHPGGARPAVPIRISATRGRFAPVEILPLALPGACVRRQRAEVTVRDRICRVGSG